MPIEIRELHIKVTVKDPEATSPGEDDMPEWMRQAAPGDPMEPLPAPADASITMIGSASWADDAFGLL